MLLRHLKNALEIFQHVRPVLRLCRRVSGLVTNTMTQSGIHWKSHMPFTLNNTSLVSVLCENGSIIKMIYDTRDFHQKSAHGRLRVRKLQLQLLPGHSHIWVAGMSNTARAKQAEHTPSQPPHNVQGRPMNIHQMIDNGRRPDDSNVLYILPDALKRCKQIFVDKQLPQNSITSSNIVPHVHNNRRTLE